MLSFKFICNQYTIIVKISSVCKMMYIISIENMLRIHDYVFDYYSKFIACVSPLRISASTKISAASAVA